MTVNDYFLGLRQTLILDEQVMSFKIVKEIFGNNDGFIRVKCILNGGNVFEFAEYVQVGQKRKVIMESYSYHWQTVYGKLIKRWDNAPHHREIATFPHHLHDGDNVCESKPVTLTTILKEIARHR
jgi:hypothetical protein